MDRNKEEPAIIELFRHNTWATLKLLETCSALTDEQLGLSAPGVYGSVGATLVHLVHNEGNYLNILTGRQPFSPLKRGEFPGVAELIARTRTYGEMFVREAAQAQAGDTVTQEWQGQTMVLRKSVVLAQAINHATEHRAHISTVLSQNGIEVPAIDVWAYGEEMEQGKIQP